MVTQSELSTLLLDHAKAQNVYVLTCSHSHCDVHLPSSIAAPDAGEKSDVPAEQQSSVDLTQAIATIASARKAYSESKLPPTPPNAYRRWRPERTEDAPHDPNAYFPMILVK